MARGKTKKVFYNRRHKMPPWAQLYAVWGVVAIVILSVTFFTSVERIPTESPAAMPTAVNGFADGLFYELRDSDAESQPEILLSYAQKLEKKHGYKVRETALAGCKTLRLRRGSSTPYGVAAHVEGEKSQAAFALLTFLDRAPVANAETSVDAMLVLGGKNCDTKPAIAQFADGSVEIPVALITGEGDSSYQRIFHLRDLKLRRYFESAFLTRERTLWADLLAMLSTEGSGYLALPVKTVWATGTEAMLKDNALAHHPVFSRVQPVALTGETALYLGKDTQLHKGGFIALLVLLSLFSLIPFFNAIGTFKERIDLSSALTSSTLYGLAFFGYFALLKLALRFIKADAAAVGVALALLPAIYIPVRLLQRSVLRAELNRAGLHLLVWLLVAGTVFVNPLIAVFGMLVLTLLSGFSRAALPRRILRLTAVALLIAVFFFATRSPLGTFMNFFSALLPSFSVAQLPQLALLCFIGGNFMALLFVPRERV
ncbi:MAG: hypothetical protein U1F27_08045 [Turneriella sp.]